jgi:hypothetical protein
MAGWLVKDPIAILNAISKFRPCEACARAAHDHTFTTTSLPMTRELPKSVVAQESANAPSKATHNRPVAVDLIRLK